MSSLNSILNIGASALKVAQSQLNVTSDNISNVNTTGYIRKVASQETIVYGGVGAGVRSGPTTLASNQYLEAASFTAAANSAQADASYNVTDQIQSLFGDISSTTDQNTLFSQASSLMSDMMTAAETPTSSAQRQQTLNDVSNFLSNANTISTSIQQARANADTQISGDVSSINSLLKNIGNLNTAISAATASGSDITAAQNTQIQYLDQLSKLVDINVTQNATGGVSVNTTSGTGLVNGGAFASLSYTPATDVNATTTFNPIVMTGVSGETRNFNDSISSGELKGLLDARDTTSVAVNDQLNEYVRQFTNTLNAAHNQGSAVPAPSSLTGKNTSLTQSEAISNFSGATNLVTLDANGNVTHTLNINFTTGALTLDGSAAGTFTSGNFVSSVNSALGGAATLSFNNGVMSVSAAGGSNAGVAIVDPSTGAASKSGQGFSQYFGLNDLVTSSVPTTYNTGLSTTSNSGFTSGAVGFTVKSSGGSTLASVNITMPVGTGSMNDLLTALNDNNTGLGRYGAFSLDANGALTFQGYGSSPNTLNINSDTTSRNGTGASFSQFFGLGGTQGTIATNLSVNSSIASDSANLALAKVNLSTTNGVAALSSGDGSNASTMAAIGNQSISFAKAGMASAGTSTLNNYGTNLAGQIGALAADAKTNQSSQSAILNEATTRRTSAEGVNLDEELINLTTYQQGYGAASRLIQAAKDMYDTLLNMMS